MKPRTRQLLGYLIADADLQTKWLNSHNTNFDMSPQEMIDADREPEVQSYLHWNVYGPY